MEAIPLSAESIESLAAGILGDWQVRRAMALPIPPPRRNNRGWPELFVGVLLTSPAGEQLSAVFATGADNTLAFGPIMALDGTARECSAWGAAAHGDSKMERNRMHMLSYPEAEDVRRALLD